MKETKYYIKYRNMYLNNISTSEEYPENEFIQELTFRMYVFYASIFTYEQASYIIDKLINLGYILDNFNLEEVEYED